VIALSNGKRVLAPQQDICEAQNAFEAYNELLCFDPYNVTDMLSAHQILMKDMVKAPGRFRSSGVGVFRGNEVIYIAPPADAVFNMVADLLLWVKDAAVQPLVKSCVHHYGIEFIHPFPDGNGRIGRMWQTLSLYKWKEVFAWLPVDSTIKACQHEYYAALNMANNTADCTVFVIFMLQAISETLVKNAAIEQAEDYISDHAGEQVHWLLNLLDTGALSSSELKELLDSRQRSVCP
jgi:Fic family protein